jgi:hypothetical protein
MILSLIMAFPAWGQEQAPAGPSVNNALSNEDLKNFSELKNKMKSFSAEDKALAKKQLKGVDSSQVQPENPQIIPLQQNINNSVPVPRVIAAPLRSRENKIQDTGQKLKPRITTFTTFDKITELLRTSNNLGEYLSEMYPYLIPGDDFFINDLIKKNPKILKFSQLPILRLNKGLYTFSFESGEISLSRKDEEKYEFEINGKLFLFDPGFTSYTRWKSLMEVPDINMIRHQLENKQNPSAEKNTHASVSSIIVFTALSRLLRSTTPLETKIKVNEYLLPLSSFWEKAQDLKYKTKILKCSSDMIFQMAQKLAEVRATGLSCSKAVTGFDVPYDATSLKKYKIYTRSKRMEIISEDGKEILSLFRSNRPESKEKFISQERTRVTRMKGFDWNYRGKQDEEKESMVEHVRELVNTSVSTDFCKICIPFINSVSKQIIIDETEGYVKRSNDSRDTLNPVTAVKREVSPPVNPEGLPPAIQVPSQGQQLPVQQLQPIQIPQAQESHEQTPQSQQQGAPPPQQQGAPPPPEMMALPPDAK